MSIQISSENEARLAGEAQKLGITVDALIERLICVRNETTRAAGSAFLPELPIWHLGGLGSLHRRDIYDDAD